jgi:hypothetical protein
MLQLLPQISINQSRRERSFLLPTGRAAKLKLPTAAGNTSTSKA